MKNANGRLKIKREKRKIGQKMVVCHLNHNASQGAGLVLRLFVTISPPSPEGEFFVDSRFFEPNNKKKTATNSSRFTK